jgi:peptidyl-prolyl cis-trans isomerase SurA
MKKIINILMCCLLCSSWLAWCTPIYAKSLEKIVAIVNDDVITQSQLDQAVEVAQRQIAASQSDMHLTDSQIKKQVLDDLILENLQLQMAKRANFTVSNADIDRAIASIAKKNNLTTQEFKDVIEKEGMNYATYKQQIGKQVLIAHLQQEVIGPSVTVTANDIKKFNQEYALHQKSGTQYRLETIVIPFISSDEATQNEQLNKAKALVKALQQNRPLEAAADTIYGKDVAAKLMLSPRLLPPSTKDELPDLFQSTVPSMQVGGYAGPIKAPNGFHILHLLGKNEQSKTLTKDQSTQLIYQEKFNDALRKWLEELKKSAYIKIMNGTT